MLSNRAVINVHESTRIDVIQTIFYVYERYLSIM